MILNGKNAECKDCIYLGKAGQEITCDYILIKGHSRPCDAKDCKRYGVYQKGDIQKTYWRFD